MDPLSIYNSPQNTGLAKVLNPTTDDVGARIVQGEIKAAEDRRASSAKATEDKKKELKEWDVDVHGWDVDLAKEINPLMEQYDTKGLSYLAQGIDYTDPVSFPEAYSEMRKTQRDIEAVMDSSDFQKGLYEKNLTRLIGISDEFIDKEATLQNLKDYRQSSYSDRSSFDEDLLVYKNTFDITKDLNSKLSTLEELNEWTDVTRDEAGNVLSEKNYKINSLADARSALRLNYNGSDEVEYGVKAAYQKAKKSFSSKEKEKYKSALDWYIGEYASLLVKNQSKEDAQNPVEKKESSLTFINGNAKTSKYNIAYSERPYWDGKYNLKEFRIQRNDATENKVHKFMYRSDKNTIENERTDFIPLSIVNYGNDQWYLSGKRIVRNKVVNPNTGKEEEVVSESNEMIEYELVKGDVESMIGDGWTLDQQINSLNQQQQTQTQQPIDLGLGG